MGLLLVLVLLVVVKGSFFLVKKSNFLWSLFKGLKHNNLSLHSGMVFSKWVLNSFSNFVAFYKPLKTQQLGLLFASAIFGWERERERENVCKSARFQNGMVGVVIVLASSTSYCERSCRGQRCGRMVTLVLCQLGFMYTYFISIIILLLDRI